MIVRGRVFLCGSSGLPQLTEYREIYIKDPSLFCAAFIIESVVRWYFIHVSLPVYTLDTSPNTWFDKKEAASKTNRLLI